MGIPPTRKDRPDECVWPLEIDIQYKSQLPEVVDAILESCKTETTIQHLDATAMPSRDSVIELLGWIEAILYPGYIGRNEIESSNLLYYLGELSNKVFDGLSLQVMRSIRHECNRDSDGTCRHCVENAQVYALDFLRQVPALRSLLAEDVQAAYDGDPAAKSLDEIIFSYPGIKAITIFRIANVLWKQGIPILPRIMTEHAHTITGVDIHPGATIGRRFFIDHGTGVVIGETTDIGDNVQLYQGVTLGALRMPLDADGNLDRTAKRHPTIRNKVTVYSGTTILGGETVIGEGAIVGGNLWVTQSIPAYTKVVNVPPEMRVRIKPDETEANDYSI
jgi:serine O-acetyltransferase